MPRRISGAAKERKNQAMSNAKRTQNESTPAGIINDISRCYYDEIRRANDKAGVPAGYRSLLYYLAKEDGKTQFELAALTGLKPPTVSIALQKMESAEYVRRENDKYDLRVTRVFLTEKGKKVDELNRAKTAEFEREVMAGITKEERETLVAILTKMKNNVIPEEKEDR